MKKKFTKYFSVMACLCLMLCCGFLFTGCGEQYIEEREYQLINMQVIKDNLPYMYSPMQDGEFYDVFIGGMVLSNSSVDVGRKNSTLIFDDEKVSGIVAKYNFSVYTSNEVYPAYAFKEYTITINGDDATNLTEEQINSLPEQTKKLYQEVSAFSQIFKSGDASLQLVTQNKSFVCHMIVLDKEDSSLLFMGVLYGY